MLHPRLSRRVLPQLRRGASALVLLPRSDQWLEGGATAGAVRPRRRGGAQPINVAAAAALAEQCEGARRRLGSDPWAERKGLDRDSELNLTRYWIPVDVPHAVKTIAHALVADSSHDGNDMRTAELNRPGCDALVCCLHASHAQQSIHRSVI
jgi:hypothetical protein